MVERAEPDGVGGVELWRAIVRRLTRAAVIAHSLGGFVMFLLLGFLTPYAPAQPDKQLALNAIVAAVYLPLSLTLGTFWAKRHGAPVERWLSERRPPTDAERRTVLGQPMNFVRVSGVFWVLAAILFTLLNLPDSGWSALVVGGGLLLAGETSIALGYLMCERIIRPITELALAGGPPPARSGPGVAGRLTMAWSLGTGVPLLGILLIAAAGIAQPDEDPLLLASAVTFLGVVGVCVGLVAITIAARSVAEPIRAVQRAIGRIEEGDLDVTVPVDDGSEVGLLEAGFNSMAAGLRERERLRDLFGRHVGREVAQAALETDGEVKLGGELREVAIVFVDVIGSTQLAVRRPPEQVVALLNAFFAIVVEVVEENCGWVNKFEGDAALCVFGAPTARPDAAGDALRAARTLADRLEAELEGATAGIGVSAGPAVAGNVGAQERFEYTVIGDPVNEAARLCELAKRRPERLFASQAVLRCAAAEEARLWEVRDSVVLRGRDEPTHVAVPRRRLTAVS
ncbi:MAG: adenylate cyclase [Thermoleophilaceae bacterium]|jgi:adenylate cyclase|nr:adenylate cyclase [Thermoleophilaceae bacterium]